MRISTKYFAFIRERLGRGSEVFEMDESSTVEDFIQLVRQLYGDKLKEAFEGSSLRPGYALAVNGETLDRLLWKTTPLKEGDVVVILPPIAGGIT
ncbi:MAG: MoaD family protein [Candidatus Caldarchaeum sp.]